MKETIREIDEQHTICNDGLTSDKDFEEAEAIFQSLLMTHWPAIAAHIEKLEAELEARRSFMDHVEDYFENHRPFPDKGADDDALQLECDADEIRGRFPDPIFSKALNAEG